MKNRVEKLERQFPENLLSEKELTKLSKLLVKSHIPQSSLEIVVEYKMDCKAIITGVQCPNCGKFAMNYQHFTWNCPNCHTRSKNAHFNAIQDYFLLIKNTITNAELRKFLHLPNPRIANKILKSLKLEHTGKNKGRVYYAPRCYPFYQ